MKNLKNAYVYLVVLLVLLEISTGTSISFQKRRTQGNDHPSLESQTALSTSGLSSSSSARISENETDVNLERSSLPSSSRQEFGHESFKVNAPFHLDHEENEIRETKVNTDNDHHEAVHDEVLIDLREDLIKKPFQGQSHFESLNLDEKLEIIKRIGLEDHSILNLRQTSKGWKTFLEQFGYSHYSVIGSSDNFITDPQQLCPNLLLNSDQYNSQHELDSYDGDSDDTDNVVQNDNTDTTDSASHALNFRHFRKLFVTKGVWDVCNFNSEPTQLVNLEELHILFNEENDQSASNMLSLWEQLQIKFPKIKHLNVLNQHRENILQFILYHPDFHQSSRLSSMENILKSKLVNVDHKDLQGNTPLHHCLIPDLFRVIKGSYFNTTHCIELLIHHGANPNIPNSVYNSPIHIASILEYTEPLQTLLALGGDINQHTKLTSSELYPIAPDDDIYYENMAMNAPDIFPTTEPPLHVSMLSATIFENIEQLLPIISAQALNTNRYENQMISEDGFAYWRRERGENTDHLTFLSNSALAYLLENGADLSIQSSSYGPFINKVICFSSELIFDFILNLENLNQSTLELPDIFGNTPILLTAKSGITSMFDKLVDYGVDVHVQNRLGQNLFHMVASLLVPTKTWIEKLVDLGIDINSLDLAQRNILHSKSFMFPHLINILSPELAHSAMDHRTDSLLSIVNNGIHLHHRDKRKISGLSIVLSSILQVFKSIPNHVLNTKLLESVIDHLELKQMFSNEISWNKFDIIDAHYLIFIVHQYGSQTLKEKLNSQLPDLIINQFQKPFIDENGLNFDLSFFKEERHQNLNPYFTFDEIGEMVDIYFTMLQNSPSIVKLVKRMIISSSAFDIYHFRKAVDATHVYIYDFPFSINQVIYQLNQIFFNFENLHELQVLSQGRPVLYKIMEALSTTGEISNLSNLNQDLFEFLTTKSSYFSYDEFSPCFESTSLISKLFTELKTKNFDFGFQDIDGATILHYAVKSANIVAVKYLVENQLVDINTKTHLNLDSASNSLSWRMLAQTPLHLAINLDDDSSRYQISTFLVNHGASMEDVDALGKTPFRYAISNGDKEIVNWMLKKDPNLVFQKGFDNQTTLMDAFMSQDENMFKLILELTKADSNFLKQKSIDMLDVETLVFCFARKNHRKTMLKWLSSSLVENGLELKADCSAVPLFFMSLYKKDTIMSETFWSEMIKKGDEIDSGGRWRYISFANSGLLHGDRRRFIDNLWELMFIGTDSHRKIEKRLQDLETFINETILP